MLSICIPIYNFDVTGLVVELSRQAISSGIPYEIILIDDCSSIPYKTINERICRKEIYIELPQNIGRSRIRNLFINYSKYNNLLFIDCDLVIFSDDFVSNYIREIKQGGYNVICGGHIYDKRRPERNKLLRWKYGMKKESQPLNTRLSTPAKSFMTSNFLIERKIIEQVKFDERISGYGHEDTLFGFQLKKNGVNIKHINNPLLNGYIEDNATYLNKTEKGIANLVRILNYVNYDECFINDVTLLRFYYQVPSIIAGFISIAFVITRPVLRFLLVKGFINLKLFDFYKLGILMQTGKNRMN
jgi:glycosyltransferase involved in cell wall biosynthesis